MTCMKTVFSLLLGVILLVACGQSSSTYVSNFRNFVEDVKDNCGHYTEADWKKADAKYDQFTKTDYNKYSKHLTQADIAEIDKLKGMYSTLKIRGGAEKLKNDIKEGTNKAIEKSKNAVEGAKEAME